ncbi:MAG: hypothetical protein V1770_00500, partial [bacterium]
IDMSTGIRPHDGLGYNSNLVFITKKKVGILPAGIIFGVGYAADVEGSSSPLAKVLSFSAGWMSAPEAQNHIKFCVSKLDLRDFFNGRGEGDIIKFQLDSEAQIWRDTDEVHFLDAIFNASATMPIVKEDKWLCGFNASLGGRYRIQADDQLSVAQEITVGADDGSYNYPSAFLLTYQIYLDIEAGNWSFYFPRLRMVYAHEKGGDFALRRDEESFSGGIEVKYKF